MHVTTLHAVVSGLKARSGWSRYSTQPRFVISQQVERSHMISQQDGKMSTVREAGMKLIYLIFVF